jgi:NarL family two-component system sensor histidine kinase LiaS
MAESMEQRIGWLQKLGEENVMLQAASNEAAVIEERRRLARDLHDTVSQQLFALHMTASALPQWIERDPQQASRLIEQLIGVSQHAQRQMRGLIAQLRPIELEGRTLQQALDRWFPDYCRHNQLQGTLDLELGEVDASPQNMPEAIEHQMFLLIQEGMANVVKHSEATRVTLSLRDTGRQYSLQIEDNGAGFDTSAVKVGSYGLATMKERAEKLGGSFEIFSRPGRGASLKVRIPKFKR